MVGSDEGRARWRSLGDLPALAVAPSLLAADFVHLADELARVEAAGADLLHVDVMDGHFVPNLGFSVEAVERIRATTRLRLDVHLMVEHPDRFLDRFAGAGADHLTFHWEATGSPERLAARIHHLGCTAGIASNPEGPAERLRPAIGQVDLVLAMGVHPGFGGQRFLPEILPKLRQIRSWLRSGQRLAVDGGVTVENAAEIVAAGADTLVAGTAIFGAADCREAVAHLRRAPCGAGPSP